jgi:hypothetical protein
MPWSFFIQFCSSISISSIPAPSLFYLHFPFYLFVLLNLSYVFITSSALVISALSPNSIPWNPTSLIVKAYTFTSAFRCSIALSFSPPLFYPPLSSSQ